MALPDESGPIERHRKVRELFERALEKPEPQRLAFLDTTCGGDAALLQEVVRLLLAHHDSASFLGTTVREKPPEKIGRYQVTGELGRGAMGIVYEAKDPLIGRTVAIKTINIKAFSQPDEARFLQQQLLKEATAAGQLSHPNIVTIHDMGIEGEMAFIAMEKLEGHSLHELLAPAEKLEPARVIVILRQCAEALDYAHENGIVHRDIKPANIMLHKGGQVKITDFGIAKNTLSSQQTGFGITLGTPSYMSPEQIHGESLDGRSDQFSLGVVAYELLTGSKPFKADTLPELMSAIRDGIRPSAHAVNPQLPPAVDPILHKVLARIPKERYKNCVEFVSALDSVLNVKPVVVPKSSGVARKVLAVLAAGLVLAALAGTEAYRFFFPHTSPSEVAKTLQNTNVRKPVAPVVLLFSADRGSPGKAPSLRWDVKNADEVFIDPEVGGVAASGSVDLKPSATKTYRLNASGPGGIVAATVEMPEEKPSAFSVPPKIVAFDALPPVVKKGGKFELRWRVEGEASDLSIDHGIGSVKGETYAAVAGDNNTTYTLTARGKTGIVTQQATIRVDNLPLQPVAHVEPTRPSVDAGKLLESAVALRNAGQPAAAVPLFRQAAELGDASAMLELGKMLLAGHDVKKDYGQALAWFRKAAEAGNPSAMVFVGVMTAKGIGTTKDETQAATWYRRAADTGYPAAMDGLGVMYANGEGVQKNPAEAVRWYQKAVERGSVAGMMHLATAYEAGTGVNRSLKDAIHFYQMASDRGDRDATTRLQQLTAVAAVTPPGVDSTPGAGSSSPGGSPTVKPPSGTAQPAEYKGSPPLRDGLNIPGNQGWVDSGKILNAGDTVTISASGNIVVNASGKTLVMTPAGLDALSNCNVLPGTYGRPSVFPAPMSPCWSLIGRIGPTGKVFAVGTLRVVQAPVAGRLLLGVNDSSAAGNMGYWNASIRVVPGAVAPAGTAAPDTASPPEPTGPQIHLTGIQPGTINGKKSQKYTITGSGLTSKTVVSLANLRVYIGSKSGVADYYPAEVAKDGSYIKIYIGPLPGKVSSVRILAQRSASASDHLDVPVKR